MRSTPNMRVEKYRSTHPTLGDSPRGENWGYFVMAGMNVIAMDGKETGWEHVSVSHPDRCPTWGEMCKVKELFWMDTECVVQLHPPKHANISIHDHCLHLWRKVDEEHPLPPREFV